MTSVLLDGGGFQDTERVLDEVGNTRKFCGGPGRSKSGRVCTKISSVLSPTIPFDVWATTLTK